jgi:hypothetical protein
LKNLLKKCNIPLYAVIEHDRELVRTFFDHRSEGDGSRHLYAPASDLGTKVMESHIAELERHYQVLFSQYQSGAIDEATFIAEADKLQIQDNYGRYWMIGAQSGAWHYFDGQTWHQAEPRDADKLPFMDEQGRYWQRGEKSGDWYYFQPETNEWVKPDQTEPVMPVSGQHAPAYQADPQPVAAPATHTPTQQAPTEQFDTELFQDDDGRYWSVGTKTGQWYFYDSDGWHPAEEFEQRTGKVQPQHPSPASYASPPVHQPVAPTAYTVPPQPQAASLPPQQVPPQQQPQAPVSPQPVTGTPVQPVMPTQQPAPATQGQILPDESVPVPAPAPTTLPQQPHSTTTAAEPQTPPTPPGAAAQSGMWLYFDGQQWLQYSTGEPVADVPPDPKLILEQEPHPAKQQTAATPITAEFIAEDEPPIEVVDVEVITVVEPEPSPEPVQPTPSVQVPQPAAAAPSDQEPIQPDSPKTGTGAAIAAAATAAGVAGAAMSVAKSTDVSTGTTNRTTSKLSADEVVPRREKSGTDLPAAGPGQSPAPDQESVPNRRPPSGQDRPVTPRKRARSAAQEPTIIIPTGATTTPARAKRPVSRPTAPVQPQQRRRARENTLPMEPVKAPSRPVSPTPQERTKHHQVTQAMPVVTRTPKEAPAKPETPGAKPTTQPQKATPKPKTGQTPRLRYRRKKKLNRKRVATRLAMY